MINVWFVTIPNCEVSCHIFCIVRKPSMKGYVCLLFYNFRTNREKIIEFRIIEMFINQLNL